MTEGNSDVRFETPSELLGRLKLGREEFCQRLLTTLLLHGPYPRWNTRSALAPTGLEFLRRLHGRCFGDGWPGDEPLFVDELELAPRHDAEKGGAPDYAVLWDDHVWLIELKTEKGSHRPEQVPYYFELANHHFPATRVDLTYLTAPMDARFTPDPEWGRYAHTTWADLTDLIHEIWVEPTAVGQQEVVDGLLHAIDHLHLTPTAWRALLAEPGAPVAPPAEAERPAEETSLGRGMDLVNATAEDHAQRALDVEVSDLEELLDLRLQIRDQIANSPVGSPLRHVRPWIWRPESTGAPLTAAGQQTGMEMRLSWYKTPVI